MNKNIQSINGLKNRLKLVYGVLQMYPELAAPVEQAINHILVDAMPNLEKLAESILNRFGSQLGTLSDDVVANWMLRLSESDVVEKFDPAKGYPKAYFGRVMRNVAMETIRPLSRQFNNADALETIVEMKATVLDQIGNAEALELVRKWCKQLPQQQYRALIKLYPFLGDDEGGAACGVPASPDDPPPHPSYATVSRARASLHDYLQTVIE